MRHFEIPFEEILIPLDKPETRASILKVSPSGKVPALSDGDLVVWESLAIAEYLFEKYPEKFLWPRDRGARANARAISFEMAAGFQNLRSLMPHNLKLQHTSFDSSKAKNDIERVMSIWKACLETSGGPFLFKEFSIADAMYAPVVNRFVSYAVPVEGMIRDYVHSVKMLPAHQEWIKGALTENF